ncbi:MAG: HAMP domain-containing histidine kinase [Candidatus Zixiibacteriota bacterium]|nr:MAG: HAMP domain-containing histidine kinase [candidate division Zixibacteria bacterium]
MKRLKILILVFCLALSIPLAYFVLRTYRSLEQEETAELRYFAVTLFDQMEEELAALVLKEELRPVDQYSFHSVPKDQVSGSAVSSVSPLSKLPKEPFVLGYFQNNPDGSFQTPLVESDKIVPPEKTAVVSRLKDVNEIFNLKRTTAPEGVEIKTAEMEAETEREEVPSFAEKYLNIFRAKRQRSYLGRAERGRVEQITPEQALSLAQKDQRKISTGTRSGRRAPTEEDAAAGVDLGAASDPGKEENFLAGQEFKADSTAPSRPLSSLDPQEFQVEVDPMQSVLIDDRQILVFRRIVINNQIYRQGFVIKVKEFLHYLIGEYFAGQPMSRFTNLRLSVIDQARETAMVQSGAPVGKPNFSLDRSFPRPFSFLRATLRCEQIPKSVGRSTLNIMIGVLAFIILLGLFTIYQSARAVVALSVRRARFASSVTHELKTPLTNIRMYVEMLEQGIARDHEREQEYFRILGSESSRLSRLINNVLEFSKLEKKQRHVNLQQGNLDEVIQEVEEVMQEKLRQEGFDLKVEREDIGSCYYDREAMIQVLINLIENSMKFGKSAPRREITLGVRSDGPRVKLNISDSGPGIPRHALKKVFDDFYRVDDELTRATGGTGIGLALVKKLVTAMGGSVSAANNDGPGCTITITLPK